MSGGAQQIDFFSLVVPAEYLLGLGSCQRASLERCVCIYDFTHAGGYLLQLLVGGEIWSRPSVLHARGLPYFAIKAAWERIVDDQNLFRIHLAYDFLEHKAQ